MTAQEIRQRATRELAAIITDFSGVELTTCKRCIGGMYSTRRGPEGCSTCVSWKPGFRPTKAGMVTMQKVQLDAQLRTLRIEYAMERDLIRIGEGLQAHLENLARRGKDLKVQMEGL